MRVLHSPGPWEVVTRDGSIGSIEDANGDAVAQAQMRGTLLKPNIPQRISNAYLIAAAPETYEALLDLVACIDDGRDITQAIAAGRLALIKARGNHD